MGLLYLYLLPNNTVSETFLHKLGAVGNIDWIIYHWGAGLAVTGRIYDIGQNISHSSFWTGSNSSHHYFHIFFLIAFLNEALNRNIIVLCISDLIVICINDDSAVINNNYGRLCDLILFFKIPMGVWKYFFEIYRQIGQAPSKRCASPGLGHDHSNTGKSLLYFCDVYNISGSVCLETLIFEFVLLFFVVVVSG